VTTTSPARDDHDRNAADVAWDIEPLVDGKGAAGVEELVNELRNAGAEAIAAEAASASAAHRAAESLRTTAGQRTQVLRGTILPFEAGACEPH